MPYPQRSAPRITAVSCSFLECSPDTLLQNRCWWPAKTGEHEPPPWISIVLRWWPEEHYGSWDVMALTLPVAAPLASSGSGSKGPHPESLPALCGRPEHQRAVQRAQDFFSFAGVLHQECETSEADSVIMFDQAPLKPWRSQCESHKRIIAFDLLRKFWVQRISPNYMIPWLENNVVFLRTMEPCNGCVPSPVWTLVNRNALPHLCHICPI